MQISYYFNKKKIKLLMKVLWKITYKVILTKNK